MKTGIYYGMVLYPLEVYNLDTATQDAIRALCRVAQGKDTVGYVSAILKIGQVLGFLQDVYSLEAMDTLPSILTWLAVNGYDVTRPNPVLEHMPEGDDMGYHDEIAMEMMALERRYTD